MAEEIATSRAEAKRQSLPRYSSGGLCHAGHAAPRITANGACTACLSIAAKARWAAASQKPQQNPEVLARYRGKHAEALRERQKAWRAANPDGERQKARRWAAKHPDYMPAAVRNRRAKMRGAGGTHTAADIADLKEAQAGICAGCAADLSGGYEVDHIMPIALGGRNSVDNLQLLCMPCNRTKGARHPDEWRASIVAQEDDAMTPRTRP